MLEYRSALCSSHWYRGFLHEVLDCSQAPGGLRVLVLKRHQRFSATGDATIVVFFAPGISAVAVAAWKYAPVQGNSAPWRELINLLKEPSAHFTQVTAILAVRCALTELRLILKTRSEGARHADLLLTSSSSGAVVEFASHARAALRPGRRPTCASLASYLLEFPTEAPTVQVLDAQAAQILRDPLILSEPPKNPQESQDDEDEELDADDEDEELDADDEEDEDEDELEEAGLEEAASARRQLPMGSGGESRGPNEPLDLGAFVSPPARKSAPTSRPRQIPNSTDAFAATAMRLLEDPNLFRTESHGPPETGERIEVLGHVTYCGILLLVHFKVNPAATTVVLFMPPRRDADSARRTLLRQARELILGRDLAGPHPAAVPENAFFYHYRDCLPVLGHLINGLILCETGAGCTQVLLPPGRLRQTERRCARGTRSLYELGFELPDAIDELSATQRESRCTLGPDICTLDAERLFLQGALPLPIHGTDLPYRIGLWAEVRPATVQQIEEWRGQVRPGVHPPLPGELANRVPLVPTTTGLNVDIHFDAQGRRPHFVLKESAHPLSLEQLQGIEFSRAAAYTASGGSFSPLRLNHP